MTAAAFRATIHGLKTVPTRKVCQLTVEFPIEQLAQVAQIAEHGAWVGIARLNEKAAAEQPARQEVSASAGPDKPKRKFETLTPAQQAGILCGELPFRVFLNERHGYGVTTAEEAAEAVRELCKVKSRALLTTDNGDWSGLLLAYRLWQNHPELEDA